MTDMTAPSKGTAKKRYCAMCGDELKKWNPGEFCPEYVHSRAKVIEWKLKRSQGKATAAEKTASTEIADIANQLTVKEQLAELPLRPSEPVVAAVVKEPPSLPQAATVQQEKWCVLCDETPRENIEGIFFCGKHLHSDMIMWLQENDIRSHLGSNMRSLAMIRDAVCAAYGLRKELFHIKKRRREVARPRQVAMYLMKHYTMCSFPTIGRFFKFDHTTIMWGVRKIEELLDKPDEDVVYRLNMALQLLSLPATKGPRK